jgi:hypothetical protein
LHLLQLDPPLPVYLPDGPEPQTGLAHILIDYGPEHHLMWVIILDQGGEIWTLPNPAVRGQKNITMGRSV